MIVFGARFLTFAFSSFQPERPRDNPATRIPSLSPARSVSCCIRARLDRSIFVSGLLSLTGLLPVVTIVLTSASCNPTSFAQHAVNRRVISGGRHANMVETVKSDEVRSKVMRRHSVALVRCPLDLAKQTSSKCSFDDSATMAVALIGWRRHNVHQNAWLRPLLSRFGAVISMQVAAAGGSLVVRF